MADPCLIRAQFDEPLETRRLHAYEGHKLENVVVRRARHPPIWRALIPLPQYPIRVMRLLGASIAILTNAAGGLNSSLLKVGSIVALVDHISLPSLVSRRCSLSTAACLRKGVQS